MLLPWSCFLARCQAEQGLLCLDKIILGNFPKYFFSNLNF